MSKMQNIAGHPSILSFVRAKLRAYEKQEKNYKTLFEMMFSERENIMAEYTDGYRIKTLTYGQFRQWILEVTPAVRKALGNPQKDTLVGIYMGNSMQWLVVFWSVLMCGCRPVLMNTRLDDSILEQLIAEYRLHAIISDGKSFSITTLNAEEILVRGEPDPDLGDFGSEIIFMSSGTTDRLKLCAYTGENFYYQVCSSVDIVSRCPDIAANYQGHIKQLMLLPLYHVFGFMAVYLWFGFFSRTFVFLKDNNPTTILATIRKHKVTHIFAVPLVWESVHREAVRKIKAKSPDTYKKFRFFLDQCNKTGAFGNMLAKKVFQEVRDATFGNSVKCLISGGSSISSEALAFYNGIGYPLFNGYGMTEVGITSVETAKSKKMRIQGAVGKPFGHAQYEISKEEHLLIRSKAMASRILSGGTVTALDENGWFDSNDIAREEKGRFYLGGRADDLIVCENGENINPVLAEVKIHADGCKQLCLFGSDSDGPTLLAYAPDCCTGQMLQQITSQLRTCLQQTGLAGEIKKIAVTSTPLMRDTDFKISRRSVAKRYDAGEFAVYTPQSIHDRRQEILSETEKLLCLFFAQALGKPEPVGIEEDFFTDLGGTSLDYFMLKDQVMTRFGVDLTIAQPAPTTVAACCEYITKKVDEYGQIVK